MKTSVWSKINSKNPKLIASHTQGKTSEFHAKINLHLENKLHTIMIKGDLSISQCLVTPRTTDYQAPPSMGFSRQEYWSGVPLPSPTLCNHMNCSTPGLPVHHQLQEFTQTHVHRVSDATQPSHPLSSPSPPAPNPSQHQCLFQ